MPDMTPRNLSASRSQLTGDQTFPSRLGFLLGHPVAAYPDRMLAAVRKSMACLGVGLGLAICAACGGSIVTTAAPQSARYNQTWTKSYGLTTCGDWNDQMTDSQQWVAAADILTGARKKWDGGEDPPGDPLITRFQRDITEACSVDDDHQLPEIAVGTYLIGRDRYSP
jgi:hypothetical protein